MKWTVKQKRDSNVRIEVNLHCNEIESNWLAYNGNCAKIMPIKRKGNEPKWCWCAKWHEVEGKLYKIK